MTPVWAKDIEDKWQPFPTHLVETLSDGSLGFKFYLGLDNSERRKFFHQFRQHFESAGWFDLGGTHTVLGSYHCRLLKQPTNE